MSSPPAKRPPIPFGKFLLVDRVNVGGMAEVWRAKWFGAQGFERVVAIKRILPNIAEDEEFISMFVDEAKIAVKLTHANIAQVYELGQQSGSYYIAMEYVSGRDLRALFDRCRRRSEPAPVPLTAFVISKLCEGLDYAHRKKDEAGRELGIVHRDVSPQNVLMSWDGEVKLIDFGIAKAANKATKTQAGILKGKFGYMSPEQVRGLALDRRSDVFAIGVCLFEMLSGERLFAGESDYSVLEKVRKAEVPPPSRFNPRVPQALERIVFKALAREPNDRYAHASELGEDLQRFLLSTGAFIRGRDLGDYLRKVFPEEHAREEQRMAEAAAIGAPASLGEAAPPTVSAHAVPPPEASPASRRAETPVEPARAGATARRAGPGPSHEPTRPAAAPPAQDASEAATILEMPALTLPGVPAGRGGTTPFGQRPAHAPPGEAPATQLEVPAAAPTRLELRAGTPAPLPPRTEPRGGTPVPVPTDARASASARSESQRGGTPPPVPPAAAASRAGPGAPAPRGAGTTPAPVPPRGAGTTPAPLPEAPPRAGGAPRVTGPLPVLTPLEMRPPGVQGRPGPASGPFTEPELRMPGLDAPPASGRGASAGPRPRPPLPPPTPEPLPLVTGEVRAPASERDTDPELARVAPRPKAGKGGKGGRARGIALAVVALALLAAGAWALLRPSEPGTLVIDRLAADVRASAAVSVDGQDLGTPAAWPLVREVPSGRPLTVTVTAPGHAPFVETVEVAPGRTVNLNPSLRKLSAVVRLQLEEPTGAALRLDGREVRASGASGPVVLEVPASRELEVTAERAGYKPYRHRFTPQAGLTETRFEVRMEPEAEAPVRVLSEPPGATILVNGTDVGRTPALVQVPTTARALTLRLTCHEPVELALLPPAAGAPPPTVSARLARQLRCSEGGR